MKSSSELTDFYYKTLYPVLSELEKDRERLKWRVIKVATLYTIAVGVIEALLFNAHISLDILLFSGFAFAGGFGFIYKFLIKDYRDEFKQKVIAPLIKALDSNLNYSAQMHISQSHFTNSKLFTSKPDRVSGNDYVSGKIEGINIEFSDFHAQKKHKDSKGRTSWSTIFQGLFIISEFNKNFHGTTIILPDRAQNAFGNIIGAWLQSKNSTREELIKMDNIEFEKEFVVYGSDQIEARYILSPSLMKRLLDFKKRSGEKIYISFSAKQLHLAIAYNKDLFEPSIFHSLLKYKIAMEYVETLHLAIGIVQELQLNTKLWSKI